MKRYKNRKIIDKNVVIAILFVVITLIAMTVIIFATNTESGASNADTSTEKPKDTTVNCSCKTEETSELISTLPITIVTTTTETVVEPQETLVSLGEYRLTAYCPCSKCCGKYGENRPTDADGNLIVVTASGKYAKANWTVAADTSVLPFGTRIYINGYEYEVQDRGGAVKGNKIDIYFDDHQDALNFGVQYAEIFIKIVE